MSEIPLNKFEKRDLVIRLLNEGKTYREVCHLAHISSRDIKLIARESERKKRLETKKREQKNRAKKPSISTQSFTLYQTGKKIDEVKVLLDIPFKFALKYWVQYLKSIRMYESYEFYQIYQYEIPTLLSIGTFIKRNNVSGKDIATVLRTANDVNNLNQYYSNLKAEVNSLEQKRNNLQYFHNMYNQGPV